MRLACQCTKPPHLRFRAFLAVAGGDSGSDVAAAESAVKNAKQGKGKASPEEVINALAVAEEQHKKRQAVGMPWPHV